MKDIGIIYGTEGEAAKRVAEKIRDRFGEEAAECRDIRDVPADELGRYMHLVFGTPTVSNGDIPEDWKENFGKLAFADLEGKNVALFGLGDQTCYPDRFADAMGLLAKAVKDKGAQIVGEVPADGYSFTDSAALDRGRTTGEHEGNARSDYPVGGLEVDPGSGEKMFYGLVLDEAHQSEKTDGRIDSWVETLKEEFRL